MTGCHFCDSEGPIEGHHIVPDRYGGSDAPENIIDVCAECHCKLENLYDNRFYDRLTLLFNDMENLRDVTAEMSIPARTEFVSKELGSLSLHAGLHPELRAKCHRFSQDIALTAVSLNGYDGGDPYPAVELPDAEGLVI